MSRATHSDRAVCKYCGRRRDKKYMQNLSFDFFCARTVNGLTFEKLNCYEKHIKREIEAKLNEITVLLDYATPKTKESLRESHAVLKAKKIADLLNP